MTARLLGRVLVVVVLLASGAYFLVYLYRWQWNRALVSGLFFVAAEVAVVASALLRRLQGIEERLDALSKRPPGEPPAALDAITASAPPPKDRFAWMGESRSSVFIPVLLGAGVLLSGAATVVERVAGATARPVLEHRLALRLQPLALPSGGLLGDPVVVDDPLAPRRGVVALRRTFAAVVAALLLYGAVDVIGDATQTRPDSDTRGTTTELVLAVHHRDAGVSATRTAEALWAACQSTLRRTLTATLDDLGGGRVGLAISPGLGEHAQRRILGCLEDATFDLVQVDVLSSSTRSATG